MRAMASITVTALLVASCGGGDDDAGQGQAGTAADDRTSANEDSGGAEPESGDNDSGNTDSGDSEAADSESGDNDSGNTDSGDSESANTESGDNDSGGDTPECDPIFSMAEVEDLFAEPAILTEETNDSLGQLVCTWETIEDPESTEDFGFKLLQVQVYSGSPISASMFFDPSIFESAVMIDGVGDLAYSADDLGTSFYFVDDPIGGSLSYTELDMGNIDAPKLRSRADIEQLFRTFHDRVT